MERKNLLRDLNVKVFGKGDWNGCVGFWANCVVVGIDFIEESFYFVHENNHHSKSEHDGHAMNEADLLTLLTTTTIRAISKRHSQKKT